MTINLANLDAVKATQGVVFDLELMHPVEETPTGLFIQIVSSYAPEVRQASRAQSNEIMKRSFEASRKGKDAKPPTIEDSERRGASLLATATIGWFQKTPGEPGAPDKVEQGLPFGASRLMFSKDEAEKLYANPGYDWLAKQVDKALGDLGNFTKASSEISPPTPQINSN